MDKKTFQLAWYVLRLEHPGCAVTARYPLVQAMLETGNWAPTQKVAGKDVPSVYARDRNMFGMRPIQSRETTSTNKGAKTGYAHYRNPLDSIRDYFLWLEAKGIHTDAELLAFIASGKYAEDKAYPAKIGRGVAALEAADEYISPTAIALGGAAASIATALGIHWGISQLTS